MQILLPRPEQVPFPSHRKKFPVANPIQAPLDEVGVDEEVALTPVVNPKVKLLYKSISDSHYAPEKVLYFAGRRPSCTVIGLGRSHLNRADEVNITIAEHLLHLGKAIQEHQQPYTLFVIDALPHDALSGVEVIVQETVRHKLYLNHKPLVSVVEKGAEGLLSTLQERYSGTPLRFIEAQKYGSDVIDAQLFGQPRY